MGKEVLFDGKTFRISCIQQQKKYYLCSIRKEIANKMNIEKNKTMEGAEVKEKEGCKLILFNDHVHTFLFVINSLMEICHHDYMQAETCTHIAHYRGQCIVKHGSYQDLLPMYDLLTQKQLIVSLS